MLGLLGTVIISLIVCFLIGAGIALVVGITVTIYTIPYTIWFGLNRGKNEIPMDRSSLSKNGFKFFAHQFMNATKVYISWITRKPPNIKEY